MSRSSKNKFINIGILLLLVTFISFRINVACNQLDKKPDDPSSSPTNLNISTDYEAVLPCASCPGIKYRLNLTENRFIESNVYIDRSDQPVEIDGTWEIQADRLILIKEDDRVHKRFIISNRSLILLDNEGDRIATLQPVN